MLKKTITALVIALALCAATLAEGVAAGYVNATDMFVARWSDAADGVEMKILPRYGADPDYDVIYAVTVQRGTLETGRRVWKLVAHYDEAGGGLVYEGGSCTENHYNADGTVSDRAVQWEDATGSLRLDDAGALRWADSREAEASAMAFERVIARAPSADTLYGELFSPVASVESGSAGASLKAAQVAEAALLFAYRSEFWNIDTAAMRDNLRAAYERLPDDLKSAFDESFDALMDAVDSAFEDYETVQPLFESAGVDKNMARLVRSEEALLSWEMLSSNVMTMGYETESIPEDAVG